MHWGGGGGEGTNMWPTARPDLGLKRHLVYDRLTIICVWFISPSLHPTDLVFFLLYCPYSSIYFDYGFFFTPQITPIHYANEIICLSGLLLWFTHFVRLTKWNPLYMFHIYLIRLVADPENALGVGGMSCNNMWPTARPDLGLKRPLV